MQTVQVDPTVTLTFDRTSESNILPLVSQLSINNITRHLNGTTIHCTERSLGNISYYWKKFTLLTLITVSIQ